MDTLKVCVAELNPEAFGALVPYFKFNPVPPEGVGKSETS
jgi:hypothetical protein